MKSITANAPTRVDIAGGTLDLWPLHCGLDHKATVNVGITLDATVTVEESKSGQIEFQCIDLRKSAAGSYAEMSKNEDLPLFSLVLSHYWNDSLPPIKITSRAKSPAGAGLGGSSCLAVTMGSALAEARRHTKDPGIYFEKMDETKLVQTSQDIEAKLISAPTGCQDYWGAVRGGVNIIKFPFGGVEVNTLDPEKVGSVLNEKMIVCYSGKSRASAINNWDIFKKFFDRDSATIQNFEEIGKIAEDCGQALLDQNVDLALNLSMKEWNLRKKIWPSIETIETKKIDEAAVGAGAKFSRVCGAGGGGVMAIFCEPEDRENICMEVSKVGGEILSAEIAVEGLTIKAD